MKVGAVVRQFVVNYTTEVIDGYFCELPRGAYRGCYGRKLPISYAVKYNGRFRRVYCTIYSNAGTCWFLCNGQKIVVS